MGERKRSFSIDLQVEVDNTKMSFFTKTILKLFTIWNSSFNTIMLLSTTLSHKSQNVIIYSLLLSSAERLFLLLDSTTKNILHSAWCTVYWFLSSHPSWKSPPCFLQTLAPLVSKAYLFWRKTASRITEESFAEEWKRLRICSKWKEERTLRRKSPKMFC